MPATFYVKGYDPRVVSPLSHPARGVSFDGTPVPVTVADVAQALGRRTPDSTVAQHHYRFGFILIVAPGSPDSALTGSVQQVEAYRQQFPAAYAGYSADLPSAETTFNHSLRLSLFPPQRASSRAQATTATLTVNTAPKTDLTVRIATPNTNAQAPASVTIPAGATSARFTVTGARGPASKSSPPHLSIPSYETAVARLQVAAACATHPEHRLRR